MKKFITTMLLIMFICSSVFAKRMPPQKVESVTKGSFEFRTSSQIGCVEAWNMKSNSRIWIRQIYVIRYDSILEHDVQDVYIKSMKLVGDKLLITNENNSEYELDLPSLEVKLIKGKLVEELATAW